MKTNKLFKTFLTAGLELQHYLQDVHLNHQVNL